MKRQTEKSCNNDIFVKITNEDIYNKLCDVEKHVIKTNGKVKLNTWMATTALALVLSLAALFFQHL